MTLAELLEGKFRGDVRFRGQAYVKAERVAIVAVTPDELFGIVRDGVEYHTQLARDESNLRMACSCAANKPIAGTVGPACKHLWATILSADEGNYVSQAAKPGFFPPFTTASDPLQFGADDWDDDDDEMGGGTRVAVSSRTNAKVELAPRPDVSQKDWEVRLNELRQGMSTGSASRSTSAGREQEVIYEIDADASIEAGCLIVQTSQRQRRASGQWGKLKPLKLRPGKFDDVEDDEDRRILAYIVGGTPDRSNWNQQQNELAATAYRYRVPHDLCELVLPALCATGRLQLLDLEERVTTGLAWDDAAPWELCLSLAFDSGTDRWKLAGWLTREDNRMPVRDARLLLPGGLVFSNTHVARLNDFDAFQWLRLLQSSSEIEVPAGDEHDLVDRLLDMPALPRLELPPELQLEEVRLTPELLLMVHAPGKAKWHQDRLKAEVIFDYGGSSIRGSSIQWAVVQRAQGRCIPREKAVEEAAWSALQDCGFRRLLDQRRGQHDVEIGARDLGPAVRSLIGQGWQVRADGKQVRQPGELKFQVKSGIDWFELHAAIDFGGSKVAFPELLSALARGDSTVFLDDGSLGILPEEWVQRYALMGGLGQIDGDHLRFSAAQLGLLDALLMTQENVDYDAKFEELRTKLHSFKGIADAREPKDFHGELRTYQREGLGWLQFLEEFNFGGCLADDMGLGKTIQMLAFLEERRPRHQKDRRTSLVVVPKSLLFNWAQEAEKFTPGLKVMEYSGLERAKLRENFSKVDLVLTTYGTLRRDVLVLKELDFDYVILDEAQAIKNSSSQIAKATRLLSARHRVALSGTPIENHLGDLCSIFDFLNPGMLGRSSIFKLHSSEPTDAETRKVLAQGLKPFILRRTKQGVANELPAKIEQTIFCEMGDEQQRLYDELRDHFRNSLLGLIEEQGLAKTRMHVLEALLRLRQTACHPALLQKSSDEESSAKLDVLLPHLEELVGEGHKTLVFSQFTSMLAIVQKHLDKMGIVYEYLDGQTRDRKERVERFQTDPECGVFLISLKAGGLGLNLTAADYVFILDPWWNPAVETQAIDRAHRVGQTKQVFAYRLICKGTVEEKIAELQQQKRELADAILEEKGSVLSNLTADDLRMLLS